MRESVCVCGWMSVCVWERERVCMGMHGCVWVCMGVYGCVQGILTEGEGSV
jgi:hypothetical protein